MTATDNAPGQIVLLSLGPEDLGGGGSRVRRAIDGADIVVGSQADLKLIADLLGDRGIDERTLGSAPNRVAAACDAASMGQVVLLTCSGDAGLYSLAGRVYERLIERGWRPGEGVAVHLVTASGNGSAPAEAPEMVAPPPSTSSSSSGDQDRAATLRRVLQEQTAPHMGEALREVGGTWAEGLAAVQDDCAEPETPYRSTRIGPEALREQLEGCREWPWVRAVVQSAGAARMACIVPGAVFRCDETGLVLGETGGRVDLRWERVADAWALVGAGDHCSLELVDEAGASVLSLERVAPAGEGGAW